jgi:ABC-type transport system involved in cytochrome bd biosynthesis fused ATPase/permease subunit
MKLDLTVETPLARSGRTQQISAMFDVPAAEIARLSWSADLLLEERPWSIGLITGPSGAGKSSCLRALFGPPVTFTWGAPSVLDDFAADQSIERISAVCQAVGFNTIPAWLRPMRVLSMGEQFRVMLARTLLETIADPIVMDEFTRPRRCRRSSRKYWPARSRRSVTGCARCWLQG